MTIDEAIKALRNLLPGPDPYEKAVKLAIEALQRIQDVRLPGVIWDLSKPLPGETKG